MSSPQSLRSIPLHRSLARAVAGGLLGGVAMMIVLGIVRLAGVPAIDFPHLLAAASPGFGPTVFGLSAFLLFSGCVGALYGVAFRAIGRAGWDTGATLGLVHWLLVGSIVGIASRSTALIPLVVPGYFGVNLGAEGFIAGILVHLLYGALMGTVCARDPRAASAERGSGELSGAAAASPTRRAA